MKTNKKDIPEVKETTIWANPLKPNTYYKETKRTFKQVEKWYYDFFDTDRDTYFNIKWLLEEQKKKYEEKLKFQDESIKDLSHTLNKQKKGLRDDMYMEIASYSPLDIKTTEKLLKYLRKIYITFMEEDKNEK